MRSSALCAAAACLLIFASRAPAADDTVAVLSSESGAYLEAFSAFQAAHGASVRYSDASSEKPVFSPETKTVVAFGSKAASRHYPSRLNVVYCMAPGFLLNPEGREGRTVSINMIPDFPRILSKLKEIQPALKRLRVFWMMPGFAPYMETIKAEGARLGVEVTPVRAADAEALPGLLRGGLGQMDAFWLPPDPFLVSPESIMILREFSWSNSIPFYGSTKGIARESAAASVGTSFADIGGAAAEAVKALQAGRATAPVIFPDKVELTLNASAAKKCGLEFPAEILREASYLFP